MTRRGAALLLVLWLLVLLSGLIAVSLGGAKSGGAAARNRLTLLKAGWAREACLEILLGRARASAPADWELVRLALDSVDLGDGVWCDLRLADPGERLNVNLATREAVLTLVDDSALVEALVRGRPWPSTQALLELPQLSDVGLRRWLDQVTVRGTGRVNLNRASPEVLRTVPGLGEDGARALIARRTVNRPFRTADEVIAELPAAARARVLAQYQAFLSSTALVPERLTATVTGHAGAGPLRSVAIVTLVPAGARLAVVRRETE